MLTKRSLVCLALLVLCMAGVVACTTRKAKSEVAEMPTIVVVVTATAGPTFTPYPTYTPLPTYTPFPTPTVVPSPTNTPEPTATSTPANTPTPKPLSELSPQQFADQYNKLTDIQQEAYLAELVGTRIRWAGEVLDVYADAEVHIVFSVQAPDIFDMDMFFAVALLDTEQALRLEKDQPVTIEGDIQSWERGVFDVTVTLENTVLVE